MAALLQRAWLRRGPLAIALLPLSWLFGLLAALRRAAYATGIARTERLPVPVIIVGNVVAGGAGKTPVVIEIVRHLQRRGIATGVVSRGHGRSSRGCREVVATSDPRESGDEPLLVARACGVPVFVGEDRVAAARALLAAHPATRVIVSDDGLQHLALGRDLEVVVFGADGAGNGWLLPAGPLREHWPRRADFVLRNPDSAGIAGYDVHRAFAGHALRADGSTRELAALRSERPVALAAIAHPESFFAMLEAQGIRPMRQLALPDHDGLDDVAASFADDVTLVCTEKDAVKLWRVRPDAWAIPLSVRIDESFWTAFDRAVNAKLSSAHGPETA